MGPGMAATFARHGFTTRLFDIKPEQIEKAKGTIDFVYKTLIGGGFMAEVDAEAGKGRLTMTTDLAEAVRDADFVVETVPEKLEIKLDVFRQLESLVRPDTVLASNTSGIPITKLGEAVQTPGRVVGMHWSNPPHIIPMIEVIGGEQTAPETVATIRDLIRGLGLLPVVVKKDVPGFVENRVLYALLREAVDLVERGVIDAEDLDTCVSWGIGYKLAVIGPMALLDMAGLDIYRSVSSFLNADLADRKDVSPLVEAKIAAGTYGIKSGAGIYGYTPETIAALQAERAGKLIATRRILEGRG